MPQVSKQSSRPACHLPFTVSGGASTAVLGLYVVRAGEVPLRLCTPLTFCVTAPSSIALCDLPVAGQSNVYHLLFLVLGIFVLGLIASSTLKYCA